MQYRYIKISLKLFITFNNNNLFKMSKDNLLIT